MEEKTRVLNLQNQLSLVRTRMDALPTPIFFKDLNGIYQGCNQAFCHLTGLEVETIIGKSIYDIASADEAKVHHDVDMALLREPGKKAYEATLTDGNGCACDVIINKATYCDAAEGRISGIVGVLSDISERKIFEKKLLESECRFRKLVEGSIQGILIHQDLKPVFVNSAFAAIFGYTEDEIMDLPDILSLIAPCDRNRLTVYARDRMEGNTIPAHYEFKGIRKSETEIWLECRALVVLWEGGPAIKITVSDITKKKQNEIALKQNEQRLKAIWDAIQTGVVIIDEQTRTIIDANPAATEMIGLPREEIIGRACSGFICPDEPEPFPTGDPRVTAHKKKANLLANGKLIPVVETINRGTLDGNPVLIDSFIDISELKAAEEALDKTHRKMAALISGITNIFIGLSESMTIVQWNSGAEKTFGIPAAEVSGMPFWHVDIPWDWKSVKSAMDKCLETGRSVSLEDLKFNRPDGKDGFLEIRLSPISYDWGVTPGILLMGAEITERKLLESQLVQAQKLESIGQLAAGIAHEINTPTQYVGDNARFLKDAFNDFLEVMRHFERLMEAAKEGSISDSLIQDIEKCISDTDLAYLFEEVPKAILQSLDGVDRISKIVRSMKEFSHPGADMKTPVDINKALESTLTVARNEWKYVADPEMDFDPALPLVPCYPGELNQVFLNIIINAAHAIQSVSQEGETVEKGAIKVTTRNLADRVEIRISDTGSGIPKEIQHRIFDPFFTTKEVGKGTGQGLAIAHRVIFEKHKGSLRFETKTGQGTVFIIELPVDNTQGVSDA